MGLMVDKMVYSELQADSRLVSDALVALTGLLAGAETPPTWKQEPRRPTEALFQEHHILFVVLFLVDHSLSKVLSPERHSPLVAQC